MKKINEIITFSGAIAAMCRGLRKQDKNEAFEVDMDTYGKSQTARGEALKIAPSGDRVCFGCAATAAIMEIAGKQLIAKNVDGLEERASALGFEKTDLASFEWRVSDFRLGYQPDLLEYFQIEEIPGELDASLNEVSEHQLLNETWRENLEHYEALAAIAKKLGY